MICVMIILNNFAENIGKRNINIFVLIDLKREIKEGTVFVMKAKIIILNASPKRKLPKVDKICIQLGTERI